eukprot:NODE_111_length_18624_cov_1.285020.p6 type:complete len:269 gc:universal NODE_111_length_18624_cov_1.285020:10337-11143(+)
MMERRKSHRIHADALNDLESVFRITQYPSNEQLLELADRHQLHVEKIRNWFNNRKAKEKRINDQEFAEKIRRMPIQKEMFETSLKLQGGGKVNLLAPEKMDWEVFMAMRNRIFELQKLLADATQNQQFLEVRNGIPKSIARSIHEELCRSVSNITDYQMNRSVNISLNADFIGLIQLFYDIEEVRTLNDATQDIHFVLEKERLEESNVFKTLKGIGRVVAYIKLESLGFGKQIDETRMDAEMDSIKMSYDNNMKVAYLHIQLSLKPLV